MVFAVADLSLHRKLLQQKILCEHIFNIGIYLSNAINVLHSALHALFPPDRGLLYKLCQNAVHKGGRGILSEFLGQLHRLIDRHTCGNFLII